MTDKWRFDSNKLIWHMDKVQELVDGKRIYPIHCDIAITKKCNAKCIYCYGIHQKMSGDAWTKEMCLDFARDCQLCGIKSVTLTGDGENTLNPNLYLLLHWLRQLNIDVGLATNGIDLSQDKLQVILSTCTWFRFNLSAYGDAGYKAIHGVQQWERVQANIVKAMELKRQLASDTTVGLQMVLIPECLEYVLPLTRLALDVRADYFVIKQYSDPKDCFMPPLNRRWYDCQGTISILQEAESLSTEQTQISVKWDRIACSEGKRRYNKCVDCALIVHASGNGKMYPCGYLFNQEEYCYGDLKVQSLKEILDSDNYWTIVQRMRTDFDVNKQCAGACRHDSTNEFVWNYMHKPEHINFI